MLYKTRFMLDELGNLQSEGHGISGFATMLSIGLGQEQQFTLILQTLQQLRDVYGDSVDKIVQGNTSNIVFLKSTDDSMIETLQKMSGTTHKSYIDSKNVTANLSRIVMQNEANVNYTFTTKEVPVIMYNDMAFIAERNSIVFRAGDSPVWNRNQTILPMSWRLFQNTIQHAGHDYSLQTIPTLSSALDFDVRKNQPDFIQMLNFRMEQAYRAEKVMKRYQDAYHFTDYEMEQIDPDNLSDDVMAIINEDIRRSKQQESGELTEDDNVFNEDDWMKHVETNTEQLQATAKVQAEQQAADKKIYAGRMLSKEDLVSKVNGPNHQYDKEFTMVFVDIKGDMQKDSKHFLNKGDGNLYGLDGTPYIVRKNDSKDLQKLNQMAKEQGKRVFSETDVQSSDLNALGSYEITDAFLRYLVTLSTWKDIANGRFEMKLATAMNS